MTFVAPIGSSHDEFEVQRLDILMWNLANLFNRQQLILDVGILFKALESPLNEVRLIVPFAIRSTSECSDLGVEISKHETATLAAPDDLIVQDHKLRIDDLQSETSGPDSEHVLTLVPIMGHTFEVSDSDIHRESRFLRRRTRWSVVRLRLNSAVQANETVYVRTRFYIYGPTAFAVWKRSGLATNGAAFDLRSYPSTPAGPSILAQLTHDCEQPVRKTKIGIVLRASLIVRNSHPAPEPKLLEQGAWTDYLGRVTDLRNEGALVLHSHGSDHPESRGPAGRDGLFINASREYGLWSYGNYARIAFLLALLFALEYLLGFGSSQRHLGYLTHILESIWALISAGGFVLIAALTSRINAARRQARRVAIQISKFERTLFSLLAKVYR